jgi:hypothetical protein
MTVTSADFCATDMRPFEAFAGKGLKALIQTALDIGVASNGRIDVNDLLANPITVRRNVEERTASGRAALTQILQHHLESGVGASCTLDLWTDAVKKNSFMSITIHYIDENFDLHARTLHAKPVRNASHTGRMVLKEFTDGLTIFNILMDSYDNITVVSDSGSNCCSADGILSLFEWHACMNHKIATVLTTVVNKTTPTNNGVKSKPFYRHANIPNMADLFQIIDAAMKLVEWFKRTNLQSLLS